jgi:hypothetical protein
LLTDNDAIAYNVLYNIGESLPSDITGVMIIPALDCWSERTDDTVNPWWKDVVKDVCKKLLTLTFLWKLTVYELQFRFAEPNELFPNTVIGHSYTTGESVDF